MPGYIVLPVLAIPPALVILSGIAFWRALQNPEPVALWQVLAPIMLLLFTAGLLAVLASQGYLGILALLSLPGTITGAVVTGVIFLFKGRRRRWTLGFGFALLYPIILMMAVSVGQLTYVSPNMVIERDALVVIEQLEHYRRDHGHYPETLERLVPAYLADLRQPARLWGWVYRSSGSTFTLAYVENVDRDGYFVRQFTPEAAAWESLFPPDTFQFQLPPTPPHWMEAPGT